MIGVTSLPVRNNHGARPCFTDLFGKSQPVFNRVREPRIPEIHAHTEPRPDHFSRGFGLLGADFGRSACSHLALREVENSNRIPLRYHSDQGSGTGEFDVVRVGRDSQDIYCFHKRCTFLSNSPSSTRYLKALLPLMRITGISVP